MLQSWPLKFSFLCVSQDLLVEYCKIPRGLHRTGGKGRDFWCLTYRIGEGPVSQAMQLEPLVEISGNMRQKSLFSSIKASVV